MTTPPTESLDPVVERTRRAREALARACDHDLDKMMDLFRSMQASHPERVRRPRRSSLRAAHED
ncbi:MAG: hypothetical protein HY720_02150 [Planctomycetes bacterium]|nr:hypothetical protein [Planctomycetota bacterium]